ncbi:uncharacterized protein LOC131593248 [Vicia villosa]|uniref:uncharacterized protein LOC131593248 n=1 Tax=Vicia villosa TaxID=3911 RepID=UPI00273CDE2C|nr:uncharacterized protein LOC131593248 [Vicia villosa]
MNNEVKFWNNAAFDGDDDFTTKMKTSWSSSSDCTKENINPTSLNFNASNSKKKKAIDDEIAEVEFEIKRLTTKLESLRLEKIASEKRVSGIGTGRVIAAKFMEPKKNCVVFKDDNSTVKRNGNGNGVVFKEATPKRNGVVFDTPKRNGGVLKEDTPRPRMNWRRGMSLGPGEIAGKMTTPAVTPATVNRRKSCYGKPQEILEESRRKTICKANSVAVGSVKLREVKKKEEEIVQPRKLFEGEKSVKKVVKQGRVVASRYNSGGVGGDAKKRSFSENNKGFGSEVRVKKRWEIPIEEVDVSGFGVLPKISTLRCIDESPRDSGAAKRVAAMNGKKSYFCEDGGDSVMVVEEEGNVCQVLDFAEGDDDDDGKQG